MYSSKLLEFWTVAFSPEAYIIRVMNKFNKLNYDAYVVKTGIAHELILANLIFLPVTKLQIKPSI